MCTCRMGTRDLVLQNFQFHFVLELWHSKSPLNAIISSLKTAFKQYPSNIAPLWGCILVLCGCRDILVNLDNYPITTWPKVTKCKHHQRKTIVHSYIYIQQNGKARITRRFQVRAFKEFVILQVPAMPIGLYCALLGYVLCKCLCQCSHSILLRLCW